jgi:hypothetical protein
MFEHSLLTAIIEAIKTIFTIFTAKNFLTWDPEAFPPCHAKVVKEGRGWPWAKNIVIHTQLDGSIVMKRVEADEEDPPVWDWNG